MNSKINLVLKNLNEQLNFIDLEIDNQIKKCEKAIEVILIAIANMKKLVVKTGFKSETEEIHFFKDLKPQFTSKLIYFNIVYKIEMKRPNGGNRILKKYYHNELQKLKAYFDNELDFYKYYRSGSSYLDYKYFLRGRYDIKLALDSYYFETDSSFSTSHDFKVARILANDLIQLYLEDQLIMIENKDLGDKSQRKPNVKLMWTGSKVALIELMYALHTEGVFNNGAADLKDIADYFEHTFDIDLGQYRRVFLEIRARKSEKSKFITTLNEALLKRMEKSDEAI
ncbi:tetracycline regulation of excision, RteC [Flavobacterium sp. L1I52]|uniref:Tetracycline regulation of excision, RteC n=1 Tax=Flavobacterium pokkalii TaxID=1940408 RepID=A0ABR7UV29_9FLAO|nr:RteC domain-containing protein [Flavobacterium pokkalii]MBD0725858.1 tetracycline regulation of excision, RteC [Flavobacterium pokkalii]